MKKCMWCMENNDCESMCDDYYCEGTKEEMLECNIVINNAEYDDVDVEDVINRWYKESDYD